MKWLQIDQVSLSYGDNQVLHELSAELEKGQIACLVGPSGCGKTSLLRAIAGFEDIFQGKIYLGGRLLSRAAFTEPPENRSVGIVFQDFALFPHLNIEKNIAFGLKKLSKKQRQARVERMLDLVDMTGMGEKYPHEISGGQQQRVAVARALAPEPELLLMDEPFSQLDPELRESLLEKLKDILNEAGTTAIVVTHQQDDAFVLGDVIGVMNGGVFEHWDKAYKVYHEPKTPFVADFIGRGLFLRAEYLGGDRFKTELGELKGDAPAGALVGQKVKILVRPDDVIHDDDSPFKAKVMSRSFRGPYYLFKLRLEAGDEILSLVQSHHDHPVGSSIGIRVEMDHVVSFPDKGA